jgi:hypothetical protein
MGLLSVFVSDHDSIATRTYSALKLYQSQPMPREDRDLNHRVDALFAAIRCGKAGLVSNVVVILSAVGQSKRGP